LDDLIFILANFGEYSERNIALDNHKDQDLIAVLDFGSQYTQLIARRIREIGVYCKIYPYDTSLVELKRLAPKGIILSGGPSSVYDEGAPRLPEGFIESFNCPILGICYGFQLLCMLMGGKVTPSLNREYGYARLKIINVASPLFEGLPEEIDVWLSHGDFVETLPHSFTPIAETAGALNAFEDLSRRLFGVQFHPEVAHTPLGIEVLRNFVLSICEVGAKWTPASIIEEQVDYIRAKIRDDIVICALSGGVDSTVAAALVQKAVGDQQHCIFVDTGLLREGEFESVGNIFKYQMGLNVSQVEARDFFLQALKGIVDPEEKRKIIGRLFIEVFEKESARLGNVKYLVQGTLYPDVIESISYYGGPTASIKSHHNVGGLPERLSFQLIEPLRELFKDEVRLLGKDLNVPMEIISRHPFPGPGLAVRIIGEISPDKIDLLRSVDRIVEEEVRRAGLYDSIWQVFPVLLPISTVGVMGDYRTYEKVIAIRAVTSLDGMTADWARLPHDLLGQLSSRLVSEVRGINRVVYDISSKPPSTIEWE
jgi:GMP synthase (glutamine-hydrolysing)